MPFIDVDGSHLNSTTVKLFYREYAGGGTPLVILHGGWGFESYPFSRQVEALADGFHILMPYRSGYGPSTKVKDFPADFHWRAAIEMLKFSDTVGIGRAALWGHSDGAVIAAMMGLIDPSRFFGLVLEAFHYYRVKPCSRRFFHMETTEPERLGPRVCNILSAEHGEAYWRELVKLHGRAWLRIAEGDGGANDLYDGRLSELAVPAIFIHGSMDPRTESGELLAVQSQLPAAPIHVIEDAGHSPHSEAATSNECSRLASEFFHRLYTAR